VNMPDLIAAVSERSGCGDKWAKLVVMCTLDIIKEEVFDRDGRVTLVKFGTFKKRLWKSRSRGLVHVQNSAPVAWEQLVFSCSKKIRKQIK